MYISTISIARLILYTLSASDAPNLVSVSIKEYLMSLRDQYTVLAHPGRNQNCFLNLSWYSSAYSNIFLVFVGFFAIILIVKLNPNKTRWVKHFRLFNCISFIMSLASSVRITFISALVPTASLSSRANCLGSSKKHNVFACMITFSCSLAEHRALITYSCSVSDLHTFSL